MCRILLLPAHLLRCCAVLCGCAGRNDFCAGERPDAFPRFAVGAQLGGFDETRPLLERHSTARCHTRSRPLIWTIRGRIQSHARSRDSHRPTAADASRIRARKAENRHVTNRQTNNLLISKSNKWREQLDHHFNQTALLGAASDGGQRIASRSTCRCPTLRMRDAPIQRHRRFHVIKTSSNKNNNNIWPLASHLKSRFYFFIVNRELCARNSDSLGAMKIVGSFSFLFSFLLFKAISFISFLFYFFSNGATVKRFGCSTCSTRHSTSSPIRARIQTFTK